MKLGTFILGAVWFTVAALAAAPPARAEVLRPFPQAAGSGAHGSCPGNFTPAQRNAAVVKYYFYWKGKYLAPSVKTPGDYKVKFDRAGKTVSEAMGYGMLLTAYLAGADTNAQACFDGLNRFRKSHPSSINPALMCWQIPPSEATVRDDCATDGDLDMALALLLAHRQWGGAAYFQEATNLIGNIATTLVRPDGSLRLGDWDTGTTDPVRTRPSDFMPAHFRVFRQATGDALWEQVENRGYAILEELQTNAAPATGLVPDFAVLSAGRWTPAQKKVLETKHDGDYGYNSCRVPWRVGWAANALDDPRARRILGRLMSWVTTHIQQPEDFRPGYQLDGTPLGGHYDSACFISPTGVAAMATGHQPWLDQTFAYARDRQAGYYEDSVNLLCLLAMSGNAWLPAYPD